MMRKIEKNGHLIILGDAIEELFKEIADNL